ncbi:MAG: D-alanyl-D-alanine carboxypeptidase/D-alanyl-D-alanine-endopeptidase [Acidobacteria bacterium]|nr:D-alanyl-D-alanine carboxypeptidase/D-alanyl-D-alanine-endopeptidase [Acidobacteriota bacterium]
MKLAKQFFPSLRYLILAGLYLLAPQGGYEVFSPGLLFAQQDPLAAADSRPAGVASRSGAYYQPPVIAIDAGLEAKIEELLSDRAYNRADWGIEVLSLDDNQILYTHNARQPMIPASNIKLFTTAAALHYLGSRYRFKTAVYARPELNADGTLRGNLVLRGGADPFFSRGFQAESASSYFDELALQLRALGVRRIDGDVIADNSLYARIPAGSSLVSLPADEQEGLAEGDGGESQAEGDAEANFADPEGNFTKLFSFSDNRILVRVTPVRNGRPVRVSLEPKTNYFRIVNKARATASRRSTLRITRAKGSRIITVTGRLPLRRKGFYTYVKLDDPAEFAAYLLKESMERNGIAVSGTPEAHEQGPIPYREMRELARHESPPLIEAISTINKQSINADAELLLRLIGTEVRGRPTPEAGISVIQEHLARIGVRDDGLAIYDGSGLSRTNAVSPHAEVTLLHYVAAQPYYPDFVSSLAVSGVDGTLRNRLASGATAQRIFGKTGTLSNVLALGGYIDTLQGKRLAFAIFCNNFGGRSTSARQGIDRIMEILASHDYGIQSSAGADAGSSPAEGQPAAGCCQRER